MRIDNLCEADLIHYKREQRKFFHGKYEQYARREPQTYERFLRSNYERLMPLFNQRYFAQHRIARDYLATVSPK